MGAGSKHYFASLLLCDIDVYELWFKNLFVIMYGSSCKRKSCLFFDQISGRYKFV